MSKGSKPRPVDGDRYRSNFDDIFRKSEWPDVIGAPPIRTGETWTVGLKTYSWDGFKWVDVTSAKGFAKDENPVFDGPGPRKEKPREFMKTNTEGDE